MFARANFWCVFNPTGKTAHERKRVKIFNSLEEAQEWVNDGRRINHGYILRNVPCCKVTEFDYWRVEYTNPIVKEIFKNFKKRA